MTVVFIGQYFYYILSVSWKFALTAKAWSPLVLSQRRVQPEDLRLLVEEQ